MRGTILAVVFKSAIAIWFYIWQSQAKESNLIDTQKLERIDNNL